MSDRTRTENSILNTTLSTGIYIVNTIIAFISRMIFVRVLSDSYLGLNSLFSNIFSVLSIVELGVGNSIIYYLYKPVHEKDEREIAAVMRLAKKIYICLGVFVAVGGLIVAVFLGKIAGNTGDISENIYIMYIIYLAGVVSGYFFSYKTLILTAHQKVYAVTGLNYLVIAVQNVVQIILLLAFKSYFLYIIVIVGGTIVYNLLINIIANKKYPYLKLYKNEKPHGFSTSELLKSFKGLIVYKFSDICVNNTDSIMISVFRGLSQTGKATNYSLFVTTLNALIGQALKSITPSIGDMNVEKSKEEQFSFFNSIYLLNFWVYSWAAIGLAFVSSDAVSLLYGSQYVMDIKIPVVLALSFFIAGLQNPIVIYKETRGIFSKGQYVLLFTAALNIIGDIVLGKYFGILGIFAATIIARLLTVSWYEPYIIFKNAFGKKPIGYYLKYISSLIILFIEGAICYFICSKINFSPIINVILKVIICTVIPNLCILFFKNKPEFAQIENVFKRLLSIVKRK